MILRPILRRAAITAVAAVVLVMALIQVWQYRFRLRAQRLHAEILALQLHPGTFADLQRLQREWGAYGDYRGVCTQEHCIYQIAFTDSWAKRVSHPFAHFFPNFNPRFLPFYALLGGRPAWTSANIRVHNNRVWGSDFVLSLEKYPGKGRNDGSYYELVAELDSSTRVARRYSDFPNRALSRGFDVEAVLNCLGCEFALARLTHQTNPSDIGRFNQIRFGCLTSIIPCNDPADLAPNLWAQFLQDSQEEQKSHNENEIDWCSIPTRTLAREANDIALVKVLTAKSGPGWALADPPEQGTIQILQPLKNGRSYRSSDKVAFSARPGSVSPVNFVPGTAMISAGDKYFFLYRQRRPGEIGQEVEILPCHAVPDTPENAKAIQEGIAQDPSNGEPYDFWDQDDPQP